MAGYSGAGTTGAERVGLTFAEQAILDTIRIERDAVDKTTSSMATHRDLVGGLHAGWFILIPAVVGHLPPAATIWCLAGIALFFVAASGLGYAEIEAHRILAFIQSDCVRYEKAKIPTEDYFAGTTRIRSFLNEHDSLSLIVGSIALLFIIDATILGGLVTLAIASLVTTISPPSWLVVVVSTVVAIALGGIATVRCGFVSRRRMRKGRADILGIRGRLALHSAMSQAGWSFEAAPYIGVSPDSDEDPRPDFLVHAGDESVRPVYVVVVSDGQPKKTPDAGRDYTRIAALDALDQPEKVMAVIRGASKRPAG